MTDKTSAAGAVPGGDPARSPAGPFAPESDPRALLARGIQCHQNDQLPEAEVLYRRVLEIDPGNPDALHLLGMLAASVRQFEAALDLIGEAIRILPDMPEYHSNLGNVLKMLDRPAEAEAAYRRAIAIKPDFPAAHYNLGNVLKAQDKLEEAALAYARAIEISPNITAPYEFLARIFYASGRIAEARKVFDHWLRLEPDSPVARHMASAHTGEGIPVRASDDYIRAMFDRFAGGFDENLKKLEYRAPELVAEAVAGLRAGAAGPADILDAGCGTGLCAPMLRPLARRLAGVDLSEKMLELARGRGLYDDLLAAELTAYLKGCEAAWDIIASADTLCYFGALDTVLAAAARALRPGGGLVFTVERAAEEAAPGGYRLDVHGRYSHTESYLRATLAAAGLTVRTIERVELRIELSQRVQGLLASAVRDSAGD